MPFATERRYEERARKKKADRDAQNLLDELTEIGRGQTLVDEGMVRRIDATDDFEAPLGLGDIHGEWPCREEDFDALYANLRSKKDEVIELIRESAQVNLAKRLEEQWHVRDALHGYCQAVFGGCHSGGETDWNDTWREANAAFDRIDAAGDRVSSCWLAHPGLCVDRDAHIFAQVMEWERWSNRVTRSMPAGDRYTTLFSFTAGEISVFALQAGGALLSGHQLQIFFALSLARSCGKRHLAASKPEWLSFYELGAKPWVFDLEFKTRSLPKTGRETAAMLTTYEMAKELATVAPCTTWRAEKHTAMHERARLKLVGVSELIGQTVPVASTPAKGSDKTKAKDGSKDDKDDKPAGDGGGDGGGELDAAAISRLFDDALSGSWSSAPSPSSIPAPIAAAAAAGGRGRGRGHGPVGAGKRARGAVAPRLGAPDRDVGGDDLSDRSADTDSESTEPDEVVYATPSLSPSVPMILLPPVPLFPGVEAAGGPVPMAAGPSGAASSSGVGVSDAGLPPLPPPPSSPPPSPASTSPASAPPSPAPSALSAVSAASSRGAHGPHESVDMARVTSVLGDGWPCTFSQYFLLRLRPWRASSLPCTPRLADVCTKVTKKTQTRTQGGSSGSTRLARSFASTRRLGRGRRA